MACVTPPPARPAADCGERMGIGGPRPPACKPRHRQHHSEMVTKQRKHAKNQAGQGKVQTVGSKRQRTVNIRQERATLSMPLNPVLPPARWPGAHVPTRQRTNNVHTRASRQPRSLHGDCVPGEVPGRRTKTFTQAQITTTQRNSGPCRNRRCEHGGGGGGGCRGGEGG